MNCFANYGSRSKFDWLTEAKFKDQAREQINEKSKENEWVNTLLISQNLVSQFLLQNF